MSGKQVLITGGAGFIGSYLVPELCARGHRVAVVDNLVTQPHGERTAFSESLKSLAVCVHGDVRDPDLWQRLTASFPETEIIIHLAAWAGTGQSAADVRECESVNCGGTAAMLGTVLDRLHPEFAFENLRHIILGSSCAVYGEGAYYCAGCSSGLVFPSPRTATQLASQQWGFACPKCNGELSPAATPEGAPKAPATFYGATKLSQEYYCRTLLHTPGLGLATLRLHNVFGPGQAPTNPYSGCLDRFCGAIVGGRPVELTEDGESTRDFLYISDAVDALAAAVDTEAVGTFNIGSGELTRLADAAHWLCGSLNREVPVLSRGTYRVGEVRHGAADIRATKAGLGFTPRVSFSQGLQRFSQWVRSRQSAATDSHAGEGLNEARQAA